jgi:uncharacterized protein YecE (DUF72 family)
MIRAGIGGWNYEPWRGSFYPEGLPQSQELGFASRALNAIEINGTFYRTQTPQTFRKWASETPPGFCFSLKAPRYAVNKRVLAEAGPSITRFAESGLDELGEKLGPILWQFAPTKRFEPSDFAAFLLLLPPRAKDLPLRHVLEVRHESFRDPRFDEMAGEASAAIVLADSDDYPSLSVDSGGFIYARLMKSRKEETAGYSSESLRAWASRAANWSASGKDVWIFFINGAKERAPAAAQAFLELSRETK